MAISEAAEDGGQDGDTAADDAAESPGRSPSVPVGTRLYVVGDVHGCVELLARMHRLILADAAQNQSERRVVVYLGDYIDRGPDSKGVVDLLIDDALPGFESVHLKGNHEQALIDFLDDIAIGPDWFSFGGVATFASYGLEAPKNIFDAEGLLAAQAALRETLSEAHLRFYRELRLGHFEGDFLMVHAGLRPDVPLDAQIENDLLWIRDPFLSSDANFGVIVVHGHTIALYPEIRSNRIGIDTGAFHTGRLTCLVLQGAQIDFLQT
jgi:serine/threonine protein phosphatase 1